MLLGRDRELAALNAYYQGDFRFKIEIVEGRHGVGKTALCQEFLKGKGAVAVVHPSPSPKDALSNLSSAIDAAKETLRQVSAAAAAAPANPDESPSWEQFFSLVDAIADATGKRPVLYLDDFPALGSADPSFSKALAAALDPQRGTLRSRYAFILISASRDGLGKALTEAGIDGSLALNTNRLKIRAIGHKAALIEPASTVDELVARYGSRGGIPLRYIGKSEDMPLSTPEATQITVAPETAEDAPTARDLALLLADAPNPFTGFTQGELCEKLNVKPLEFKRLFNELKGMDLASSVRACWFENAERKTAVRYRLADCADAVDIRTRAGRTDNEGVASDESGLYAYQTKAEMLREWVWDAGRDGSFPFEFDEVTYWFSPDGDSVRPYGVLAISDQTNAAVACRILESSEPIAPKEIDAFVELAHSLPFKRIHCALVAIDATPEGLVHAGEVRDLTLAKLSPAGFQVISNSWQLHSERYQAAMRQAAEKKANK